MREGFAMRGRLRRRLAVLTAASLGLMAIAPGQALAQPQAPAMSADLDGQPIPLTDVAKYACHDIAFPRIHCFSSEAARDASAAPLLASSSTTYVIVWADASYAGPSLIISQDYSAFVTVGWNDRISSFKAQNSTTGRFWTDWFYGGTADYFCCNQTVPYVGDAFNDTFSSFQYL